MISVLIPVFNTDVRELVSALSVEIAELNDPCEIIVFDDGSDPGIREINHSSTSIRFLKYYQGNKNHGRVEARKKLASMASHDWLLFLDDDSGIPGDHFIRKYLVNMEGKKTVLAGGRRYERSLVTNCNYALHWKYGIRRESNWTKNQLNFYGFQTNNFLIHTSVFKEIVFPPDMNGYGHEDTWMGIQLEQLQYSLKYIDNPVIHLGLQTTQQFLLKSTSALENLELLRNYCADKTLAAHVRLFKYYLQLKKTGMLPVVNVIYKALENKINKSLHSCNPELRLFDLYRLHYFSNMPR